MLPAPQPPLALPLPRLPRSCLVFVATFPPPQLPCPSPLLRIQGSTSSGLGAGAGWGGAGGAHYHSAHTLSH